MNLWTAQWLFQLKNYTADSQSLPVPAKAHSDRRQQTAARQTNRQVEQQRARTDSDYTASVQPGQLSGADTTQRPWLPHILGPALRY